MNLKVDSNKAVDILRSGGLVAFPTETVYGLGADASNEAAIRKIFAAKERPYDHPLIVHLANFEQIGEWAQDVPPVAKKLAEAFWPGPLTLILNRQPHVLDIITGGQSTIGLRIPRHPIAQALLSAFGGGVAAPSANKFTHISPTTAAAVEEELGGRVDLILDGGDCEVGLESTILDLSRAEPVILRPGMISAEQITQVIGRPVRLKEQVEIQTRAPGMHHLHYAPVTQTIMLDDYAIPEYIEGLALDQYPIAVVTHSHVSVPVKSAIKYITLSNQPSAYAHDIYHVLRELDHLALRSILIESVPMSVEWDAIRDRLTKAAATRHSVRG